MKKFIEELSLEARVRADERQAIRDAQINSIKHAQGKEGREAMQRQVAASIHAIEAWENERPEPRERVRVGGLASYLN